MALQTEQTNEPRARTTRDETQTTSREHNITPNCATHSPYTYTIPQHSCPTLNGGYGSVCLHKALAHPDQFSLARVRIPIVTLA